MFKEIISGYSENMRNTYYDIDSMLGKGRETNNGIIAVAR
jgi:hypothetical protein